MFAFAWQLAMIVFCAVFGEAFPVMFEDELSERGCAVLLLVFLKMLYQEWQFRERRLKLLRS